MQGGVWEECWGPLPGAADPPPCRCPPSASQAASVLRGSTRTPAGSACPLMSAHASLQGSLTPGAPSSTPTVRPGEPQPHPGDPGGPGMSSGCLGMAGGPPPTPCRSASCGGACVAGSPRNPRMACSSPSTCSRGKWTCQQSIHCSSTCTLYGEGHMVTFDGQRFVFDGNCEYILVTVRP